MHPPPYTPPRRVRAKLIDACLAAGDIVAWICVGVLALVVLISIALLLGTLLAAVAVLIGAVR